MENIIENNKLIAKFMGFEDEARYRTGRNVMRKPREWRYGCQQYTEYKYDEMKYHGSFDWIYPVITVIEDMGCKFTSFPSETTPNYYVASIMTYANEKFKTNKFFDTHNKNRILAFHEAVVEFIKWYNENK